MLCWLLGTCDSWCLIMACAPDAVDIIWIRHHNAITFSISPYCHQITFFYLIRYAMHVHFLLPRDGWTNSWPGQLMWTALSFHFHWQVIRSSKTVGWPADKQKEGQSEALFHDAVGWPRTQSHWRLAFSLHVPNTEETQICSLLPYSQNYLSNFMNTTMDKRIGPIQMSPP